jgi:uncharacterized protein (DUF2147 family)
MFPKLFISVLFLLINGFAYTQQASEVVGRWYTEDKKGIVEVYPCENDYCAKVISMLIKNEDGSVILDSENPDPALRNRPVEGINILRGLQYEGNGKYEGGEIYDPESGNIYSCLMRLKNDNTLEIRGYVGFSLIGRSTIWTRVGDL